MNKWISVADELPPLGYYVLIHHTLDNHFDSGDQEGVQFDVVQRREAQEYGNNLRPFDWSTFGPMTYFGQDVDFWMEIDRKVGTR